MNRFALCAAVFALAGCPQPAPGDDVVNADAADVTDVATDTGPLDPMLPPPPAGQGIQLHVSFDVPAGTEQQRCWRFELPTDTDLEVVRYEVAYNLGSHHMNLFRMLPSVAATTTVAPDTGLTGPGEACFNAVDFAHYDLVVGSQSERLDWTLPSGVAYRLHAHSKMLMQSHFVNAQTQATPGNHAEVYVNLWTAQDPTSITQHLGTMFANNRAIDLPPHQMSSFTTRCTVPAASTFIALTGHFHSRGQQFTAAPTNDGTTPLAEVYRSTAWSEPPFQVLPQPLQVPAGGGLFYTCDFFNPTDFPITFGPHVEFEEHCNLFAYYYPVDPDSRAKYCF